MRQNDPGTFSGNRALDEVGFNTIQPKDPLDFLPPSRTFRDPISSATARHGEINHARIFINEHLSGSHYSERLGAIFQPEGVRLSRYKAGGRAARVADAFNGLSKESQTLVRRAVRDATQAALKDLGVPEQVVVFRKSDPNPDLYLTPVTLDSRFAKGATFTDPYRGKNVTAHIVNRSDIVGSVQHLKHRGSMYNTEYELLVPRKVLAKRPSDVRFDAEAKPEKVPREIEINVVEKFPDRGPRSRQPGQPKEGPRIELFGFDKGDFVGGNRNKLVIDSLGDPDVPGGRGWVLGTREVHHVSETELKQMVNKGIRAISDRYPGKPHRLQMRFKVDDVEHAGRVKGGINEVHGHIADIFEKRGSLEVDMLARFDPGVARADVGGGGYIGTLWFKDGKVLKPGTNPAARGLLTESGGAHFPQFEDSKVRGLLKPGTRLTRQDMAIYNQRVFKENPKLDKIFIEREVIDLVQAGMPFRKALDDVIERLRTRDDGPLAPLSEGRGV